MYTLTALSDRRPLTRVTPSRLRGRALPLEDEVPFELGLEPALVKLAVVANRLCVRPDATRNLPRGTRLQEEEDTLAMAMHWNGRPVAAHHSGHVCLTLAMCAFPHHMRTHYGCTYYGCVRPTNYGRTCYGESRLQKEEDSDNVADDEVDHPLRQRHAQIERDHEGAPRAVWRDLVRVGVGVWVKVRVRLSWRHLVGVGLGLEVKVRVRVRLTLTLTSLAPPARAARASDG